MQPLDLGFDLGSVAIGGVLLIPLIIGLVEFLKGQGLEGKRRLQLAAFLLGLPGLGVAGAIEEGLIPIAALPWIRVVIWALAGGVAACAAMGLYDLTKKFRPTP
ncbi:MAG TPA: hypothetical protein VM537_05230 [Anaerolineae bacterium]|nr:hypothetical protein [Anaerolineae bacterium]